MNDIHEFARECGYAGSSPAMLDALARIHAATDPATEINQRRRRVHLQQARTRRRAIVNRYLDVKTYWSLLGWLSQPVPYRLLSTGQAAQLRALDKDRRVVARYFSRFGRRLWVAS